MLPIKEGMSLEGHLSGFIVGIILAIFFRKKGIVKEKFVFSKTDFDDMFDENCNYVPPPLPVADEDLDSEYQDFNYTCFYRDSEE